VCRWYLSFGHTHPKGWLKVLERQQGGDGNGIAWRYRGKWEVLRSIEHNARYFERVLSHVPFPRMFHTRWGTSGSTSLSNCHPFHNGRSLLIHNGCVSVGRELGDPRSDTAVLWDSIRGLGVQEAIQEVRKLLLGNSFVYGYGKTIYILAGKQIEILENGGRLLAAASESPRAERGWSKFTGILGLDLDGTVLSRENTRWVEPILPRPISWGGYDSYLFR
jgi:hypothetical protein